MSIGLGIGRRLREEYGEPSEPAADPRGTRRGTPTDTERGVVQRGKEAPAPVPQPPAPAASPPRAPGAEPTPQALLDAEKTRIGGWERDKFRSPAGGTAAAGIIGDLTEMIAAHRESGRREAASQQIIARAQYELTILESNIHNALTKLPSAVSSTEADAAISSIFDLVRELEELNRVIGRAMELGEPLPLR